MSEQSWGDGITATTWWGTSRHEFGVLNVLKDELLGVIEATLIDGLSKEFARGLREVSIELRHVDIIDEEDHFLASWWAEQGLSFWF